MVVNLNKYIFGFQMLDTKTKNECTVSTSISLTCIPFKFFTGKQEIAQKDAFLLYGIDVKLINSRKNRYKRPIC
jgi:hypothetical protein